MADDGILGLLGRLNDPAALYGGALTDPATKQAMGARGLLAMAGSFADSAMPTRMPTPLGAVLGHAAAAAGTSGDAAMQARLQNAQAQLAGSTVGLQNMLGPAYLAQIEEARRRLAAGGTPGGGIPSVPAPGAAISGAAVPGTKGTGPAPTGPIDPNLVAWEAKNQGLDPLVAHTGADIESSYGANTGNEKSPSHTGVFQLAPANAPGGQNDTHANQIRLGVSALVTARDGLRASLGREPTNAEVWLAHNQGVSGATKLINNPNTPAGDLVPPINISNNAGNPKAPASVFVQHWEQDYNRREAKFAPGTLTPPVPPGGLAAGGGPLRPPGGAVGGLLNLPDLTGQMNAPIPGIASGAPSPAPPAAAPGSQAGAITTPNQPVYNPATGKFELRPRPPDVAGLLNAAPLGPTPAAPPGPAAAARPPSAGEILMAAQQRNANIPGAGLPAGLGQTADASGQVIPSGPPPGPAAPNLMRGGAIPGLLGGGAPPPALPAGPPPGPAPGPQPLVTPPQPQAPVPPIALPQAAPAPPPAAPPMGAPPPLNLPLPPPMPGGAMGPPVQPTPEQMIAQGIVGISALVGKPAPDYMQKLAGQPLEMQMEAYKAYVGEQAKQMTAQYQKQLDASAAEYIAYQTSMGNLPAKKAEITHEQDLKLRNDMQTNLGLVLGSDGHYHIDPAWLDAKARAAAITGEETRKTARESYGNEYVNMPALGGWVQRKNIPGYNPGGAGDGGGAAGPPPPATGLPLPGNGAGPVGPLAGNAAPGPIPGVIPSETPAQSAFLTDTLGRTNKQLEIYQADKVSEPQQIGTSESINDLMGRTAMGWGAATKQRGAMILQGLGVPADDVKQFLGVDTAAGGTLNKLFLQFTANAVRTMGAREPGSVISLFADAYPNLESDPNAAKLMNNALRMQAQWKFDRANAAEEWNAKQKQSAGAFGQNYKGLEGFEKSFAQTNDYHDYWRAAAAMSDDPGLAWKGMSDANKQRIVDLIPAGRWFRGPDGKPYHKPGAQ